MSELLAVDGGEGEEQGGEKDVGEDEDAKRDGSMAAQPVLRSLLRQYVHANKPKSAGVGASGIAGGNNGGKGWVCRVQQHEALLEDQADEHLSTAEKELAMLEAEGKVQLLQALGKWQQYRLLGDDIAAGGGTGGGSSGDIATGAAAGSDQALMLAMAAGGLSAANATSNALAAANVNATATTLATAAAGAGAGRPVSPRVFYFDTTQGVKQDAAPEAFVRLAEQQEAERKRRAEQIAAATAAAEAARRYQLQRQQEQQLVQHQQHQQQLQQQQLQQHQLQQQQAQYKNYRQIINKFDGKLLVNVGPDPQGQLQVKNFTRHPQFPNQPGPCELAGLQVGDWIREINGVNVLHMSAGQLAAQGLLKGDAPVSMLITRLTA
jgi:hypothetical protein